MIRVHMMMVSTATLVTIFTWLFRGHCLHLSVERWHLSIFFDLPRSTQRYLSSIRLSWGELSLCLIMRRAIAVASEAPIDRDSLVELLHGIFSEVASHTSSTAVFIFCWVHLLCAFFWPRSNSTLSFHIPQILSSRFQSYIKTRPTIKTLRKSPSIP